MSVDVDAPLIAVTPGIALHNDAEVLASDVPKNARYRARNLVLVDRHTLLGVPSIYVQFAAIHRIPLRILALHDQRLVPHLDSHVERILSGTVADGKASLQIVGVLQ